MPVSATTTCPTEYLLQISGVSKSFGAKAVLRDIELQLRQGELVSLLGLSGSGKSTLFNIIAGLTTADSGSVRLRGENISGQTGHVGYMLQKDLLLPHMRVIDNIALPLRLQGLTRDQARNQAQALLPAFGLADAALLWPGQLSGGMRQRAALARTYLYGAPITLLDEPFSALDALTRSAMQRWYLQMAQQLQLSTLFITHDIEEALLLSHRVYVLAPESPGAPSRIAAEIIIDEPQPRDAEFTLSPAFLAYKRQILTALGSI